MSTEELLVSLRQKLKSGDYDLNQVREGDPELLAVDNALRELADLKRWKAEALAVEAQWDAQAVGKALGLTLGTPTRAGILPAVEKLLAKQEEMRNALVWCLEKEPSPCRCIEFAVPPHVCVAHRAVSRGDELRHARTET